eukprot:gb/GECH01013445.1/.p1 GENE.gb/GECH01013445.1/~~gb/GECH01013445.1/.p1  ORF type:complete len:596 (+),score=192.16 gb/GECH01013445.1/:1-1788(+)
MVLKESVRKLADQWLATDFNEATRKEIQDLLDQENQDELEKRLCKRISFGTAGLRGRMAAGYSCMNPLIVAQASQGVCSHLMEDVNNYKKRGVVIGYDGRYNSKEYALITAAVFLSQGIKVFLFSKIVPTPFVPYCITQKGCAAGIMITASHNPKDDNGYKVYWENGAQIIPPTDKYIYDAINNNLNLWDGVSFDEEKIRNHENLVDPLDDIVSSYFKQIREKYCFTPEQNPQSPVKVTYTAMHGVGAEWVSKALESFNLPSYIPTQQQVDPDPEFSTVTFPNPEEGKGALALAMKTAEAEDSSLILASDPDADRLAVAERQPDGDWRIFNGNEIALLFASWIWENFKKQNPDFDFKKAFMLSSTVSSKILAGMAEKEGFHFEDTLTGFKWMGNKAYELEQKGYKFLFSFEVEIGFLVGNISLDKDGVRTAAIFNEMTSSVYSQNKNLVQHLNDLYAKYGYYRMNTRYFFCYESEIMDRVFNRLRTGFDGSYVQQVGDFRIKYVRDITTGYDNSQPDNKSVLPVSKSSHMITFTFEDGSVCTLRNSGTEPKLKYYVEVFDAESEDNANAKLKKLTDSVIEELLQPEKNGLVPPKD